MVEEERYKAAGPVRVAVDSLDTNDIHVREAEQNALAEQALLEFEQKQAPHQIGAGSSFLPTAQDTNVLQALKSGGNGADRQFRTPYGL